MCWRKRSCFQTERSSSSAGSHEEARARSRGDTLEAACYRVPCENRGAQPRQIEHRFPNVLRRVGGYNLDEFIRAPIANRPFNLAKLMVGSEGTLGVVLAAKVNLVPLPTAKAVLAIQFAGLLESLAATPLSFNIGRPPSR